MLTAEQAEHFLTQILKICKPRQDYNKLDLLNEIITEYHHHIPFHNIIHMSKARSERRAPSMEEAISYMLKGYGGLCWTLNGFMFQLLQVLGYDVFLALASVRVRERRNHLVVIVNNLVCPGDRHLVEAGVGYPCFKAIPLDFDTESPVYTQSSYPPFKFIKTDDCIIRLHKLQEYSDFHYSVTEDGWGHACYMWLKPITLDQARERVDQSVYSNLDFYFNQSFRLVRWRNGKALALRNTSVLLENDDHRFKATEISPEHLEAAISSYIPELPPDIVKKAMEHWQLQQLT